MHVCTLETGFLFVFDLRQGVFDILDADGLGDIARHPCLAAAAAIIGERIRRHGKHRDVVVCAAACLDHFGNILYPFHGTRRLHE